MPVVKIYEYAFYNYAVLIRYFLDTHIVYEKQVGLNLFLIKKYIFKKIRAADVLKVAALFFLVIFELFRFRRF